MDLDADHLVCDLVAYERMVQRLGRVNRRGGQDRSAMIDVFAVRPKLKANAAKAAREQHANDLEAFERRLAVLAQLPRGEDDRRDASPAALVGLKASRPDMIEAATTPPPLHPELTRPLLDSWAMTSLRQHDGRPEVSPWLRGWDEDEEAHTNVAWRTYLPCEVHAGEVTAAPGTWSPRSSAMHRYTRPRSWRRCRVESWTGCSSVRLRSASADRTATWR